MVNLRLRIINLKNLVNQHHKCYTCSIKAISFLVMKIGIYHVCGDHHGHVAETICKIVVPLPEGVFI